MLKARFQSQFHASGKRECNAARDRRVLQLAQELMKRPTKVVVAAVTVVGVIFGGYYIANKTSTIEYVAPEVQIKVEEVQVDALEKAIKDAQTSKESEIKATAQKAYDEAYNQEMKKVELEVISDFNKKLEARQEALEGEISL